MRTVRVLPLVAILAMVLMPTSSTDAQTIDGLVCEYDSVRDEVTATWSNPQVFQQIDVYENGALIDSLFGNAETATLTPPQGATSVEYCFEPTISGEQTCCTVDIPTPSVRALEAEVRFRDTGTTVVCSWINGATDYDDIEFYACGELIDTLAGTATSAEVAAPSGEVVYVEIIPVRAGVAAGSVSISQLVPALPLPVLNLVCEVVDGDVEVSWKNASSYDAIDVLVDDIVVANLNGDATSHILTLDDQGQADIRVVSTLDEYSGENECEVEVVTRSCCCCTEMLSMDLSGSLVDITWLHDPTDDLATVRLYRNGEVIMEDETGLAVSYTDDLTSVGPESVLVYHVEVCSTEGDCGTSRPRTLIVPAGAEATFIRSDCNNDGFQDIADPLKLLFQLFLPSDGSAPLPCPDACDFNDDGELGLLDAIDQLGYMFRGEAGPAEPFPDCGPDDTSDDLGCPTFDSCERPTTSWDRGWNATGEQRPPSPTGFVLGGILTEKGRGSSIIHRDLAARNVVVGEFSTVESGAVLRSGEFVMKPIRLEYGRIPSLPVYDYLDLTYSSQIDFQGCVGSSWNLWPLTECVVELPDGTIRRFDARTVRFDDFDPDTGEAPGVYDTMTRESDESGDWRWFCRSPQGTVTSYDSNGTLSEIVDRFGNAMTFEYDESSGQLTRMIDGNGRPIDYAYDENGLLSSITDFSGRTTTFEYDGIYLRSVTSPPYVGSPNDDDGMVSNGTSGNDFPDGRTVRFRYDSSNPDPVLRDNLVGIAYPNEVALAGPGEDPIERVKIKFDGLDGESKDHAVSVEFGGSVIPCAFAAEPDSPNSGGVVRFSYENLADPIPGDTTTEIQKTTVTDPNGNVTEYYYNSLLHCVRAVELLVRGIDPTHTDSLETLLTWDATEPNLVSSVELPEGNSIEYIYDVDSPLVGSRRNLLDVRSIADSERSGDQSEIVRTFTYEPIFNQLRTSTSARGNDASYSPPIFDPTPLQLIDFNLDGDDDDADDGETARRVRYTTVYLYDYQEGTAQEISDLAEAQGFILDDDTDADRDGIFDAAVALSHDTDLNGDGNVADISGSLIVSNRQVSDDEGTTLVTTTLTYNTFGQLTSIADPEGNLTCYYYFPQDDPNGDGIDDSVVTGLSSVTGGYLATVIYDDDPALALDPAVDDNDGRLDQVIENGGTDRRDSTFDPVSVRVQFTYDSVGNVTAVKNGRGVTTSYLYNPYDEIVRRIKFDGVDGKSLASSYVTDYAYDNNGNLISRSVEDRGDTTGCGGNNESFDFVDCYYRYDGLDACVEVRQEYGPNLFTTTSYRYDPNGNCALTILPEGNASSSVYDDRNLLFQRIDGTVRVPALVHLHADDPTEFTVRGGIPVSTMYLYDGNGALIETVDGDDTDGSSDNNSSVGIGDRTRVVRDGHGRVTSVVDPAGNQAIIQFDPDGNVVRRVFVGPPEGATPTSDGPDDLPRPVSEDGVIQPLWDAGEDPRRVPLAIVECLHDELSRPLRVDRVLFHNGIALTGTLDLADGGVSVGKGDLVADDDDAIPGLSDITILGRVNKLYVYDQNSQVLSITEDDLDVTTMVYDGLQRLVEVRDAAGNLVEHAYDANDNRIETRTTDTDAAGVYSKSYLTSTVFDLLDRPTQVIDNIGATLYYGYDSLDNLVVRADQLGPDGSSYTRHFQGGSGTESTTNDPGNVCYYSYDGMGRNVLQEQLLTVSGEGDGTLGVDDDGVRGTAPAVDTTQGGGDGIVSTAYVWDDNSNLQAVIDDQGNVTLSLFDHLDRQVAVVAGLTATSQLDASTVLGDRGIPLPTGKSYRNPVFMSDSTIDDQLDGATVRLAAFANDFPALADRIDDPTSSIYGIDGDGNQRYYLDPNGSEFFSNYDVICRCTHLIAYPAGDCCPVFGDLDFDYPDPMQQTDSGGAVIIGASSQSFEYDGMGRVVRAFEHAEADDEDVECSYSWDSLSRLVEETLQVGDGDICATTSAWRSSNLRSSLTYPSGLTLTSSYDHLDRLLLLENTSVVPATEIASCEYIGPRMVRRTLANGTELSLFDAAGTTLTGLDARRVVTSLDHLDSSGTRLVGREIVVNQRMDLTSGLYKHDATNDEEWALDSMSRPLSFERPTQGSLSPIHGEWTLDGVGNWSSVDDETRSHTNYNELYLQSTNPNSTDDDVVSTHDDNNNLESDGELSYEFDVFDRLRRVTRLEQGVEVTVAEYGYCPGGRRAWALVGGATEYYCYDGQTVIEDRDDNGDLSARYVQGGRSSYVQFEVFSGSPQMPVVTTYYPHTGQNGSTYGLSDSSGTLVEAYMYDTHGYTTVITPGPDRELTFGGDDVYTQGDSTTTTYPYLFCGERFDEETGMYCIGSMYLDTVRGRSLSKCGKGNPLRYSGRGDFVWEMIVHSPASGIGRGNPLRGAASVDYVKNVKQCKSASSGGGSGGSGGPGGYVKQSKTAEAGMNLSGGVVCPDCMMPAQICGCSDGGLFQALVASAPGGGICICDSADGTHSGSCPAGSGGSRYVKQSKTAEAGMNLKASCGIGSSGQDSGGKKLKISNLGSSGEDGVSIAGGGDDHICAKCGKLVLGLTHGCVGIKFDGIDGEAADRDHKRKISNLGSSGQDGVSIAGGDDHICAKCGHLVLGITHGCSEAEAGSWVKDVYEGKECRKTKAAGHLCPPVCPRHDIPPGLPASYGTPAGGDIKITIVTKM